MTELTFSPRESPYGYGSHKKVSSWWIDGSRDRYGEALFLSPSTTIPDAAEPLRPKRWVLWINRRPYGVNQMAATFHRKPATWAEIDEALR